MGATVDGPFNADDDAQSRGDLRVRLPRGQLRRSERPPRSALSGTTRAEDQRGEGRARCEVRVNPFRIAGALCLASIGLPGLAVGASPQHATARLSDIQA